MVHYLSDLLDTPPLNSFSDDMKKLIQAHDIDISDLPATQKLLVKYLPTIMESGQMSATDVIAQSHSHYGNLPAPVIMQLFPKTYAVSAYHVTPERDARLDTLYKEAQKETGIDAIAPELYVAESDICWAAAVGIPGRPQVICITSDMRDRMSDA